MRLEAIQSLVKHVDTRTERNNTFLSWLTFTPIALTRLHNQLRYPLCAPYRDYLYLLAL
jgi:hypothetical protein